MLTGNVSRHCQLSSGCNIALLESHWPHKGGHVSLSPEEGSLIPALGLGSHAAVTAAARTHVPQQRRKAIEFDAHPGFLGREVIGNPVPLMRKMFHLPSQNHSFQNTQVTFPTSAHTSSLPTASGTRSCNQGQLLFKFKMSETSTPPGKGARGTLVRRDLGHRRPPSEWLG